MSTLILIRHGQASFGAANYDVLSERGIEQSAALGAHLAAREISLDAVYTGPAVRQIDTAAHLLDAASSVGTDYPQASKLDELDEYPAFELFKDQLPKLKDDPDVAALLAEPTGRGQKEVYVRISQRWARGELDTGGLETFAQFEDRVHAGFDHIMATEGRGKAIAVVTSGGPISLSMRRALDLAPERALQVAWVIANASMTEYRYRDGEFTLVGFNRIPHLDKHQITYR
ncbi:MAG: histidine phosphatase family protein [Deltaproteobacteria bacterium]|nr:histidine phosphatase family protein [Deltaproteobacteria bacterium]